MIDGLQADRFLPSKNQERDRAMAMDRRPTGSLLLPFPIFHTSTKKTESKRNDRRPASRPLLIFTKKQENKYFFKKIEDRARTNDGRPTGSQLLTLTLTLTLNQKQQKDRDHGRMTKKTGQQPACCLCRNVVKTTDQAEVAF